MKTYHIALMAALLALTLVQPAYAGWYDTAWVYRKNITFNSSLIAQDGLSDFPALINISDSSLSTFAEPSGDDILFTDSDGTTKLDHEIENFTYSIGTLVAWVRIPNLYNTTNQTIYMYFNSSGSPNQQNRTGVWNASWLAVWHFSDRGARNNDSTRYNNNGTRFNGVGGVLTSQDGGIGGANNFDGADDGINVTQNAVINNLKQFSLVAWVNADTYGESSFGRIMDKQSWLLFVGNTNSTTKQTTRMNIDFATNDGFYNAANNTMRTNSWQHTVVTYNVSAAATTNATFYRNGSLIATFRDGVLPSGAYVSDAAFNLVIGNSDAPGSSLARTFDGKMTEVRIYNGTLNPDQIKTEYNNQYVPSTFISVGGGEALTCNPPPLNQGNPVNWTIEASDNCVIDGKSIQVTNIFIQGSSGTVIFRNSNVTATDCRIQPNAGSLITLAIEAFVNWGNAC
ncbi:MAG: DUF2341 domain-containing protein [Candidatus Aenigmarchaeota archaeon]|nr:DUF2341 domain-containing protein [Candidatus Aenigmarchaeota archaeon]